MFTQRRLITSALVAMLAMFALESSAFARAGAVRQAGNVGVGVGQGTLATLLSIKYFMDPATALQFNVGFYNARRDYYGDTLALGFDYLLEQPSLTGNGSFELAWSVGPGLSLGLSDGRYRDYWIVGASGVVGLEFLFNMLPLDVVLEYRPTLFIYNNNFDDRGSDGFDLDLIRFGAHIRFFF